MMKIMYKHGFVLLLVITTMTTSLLAQGKKTEELLSKVSGFYQNTKQYQIDVTYNMHRGFTGNNITESYKGTIVKKGDFSKFVILDSEIIRFPKVQLTIDHAAKNMVYTEVDNSTTTTGSPLDISSFLEQYNKTVVSEKNGWFVCEMVSSKKDLQNPYGKLVLYINKQNYQIEKQELFFATLVPFVDQKTNDTKGDYGRLVILLNHKALTDKKPSLLKDYVSFSSNRTAILTEKYKAYNFINQAN